MITVNVVMQLPEALWDWIGHLSPHQWMVLTYLARHGWGQGDPDGFVSLSEMQRGKVWGLGLRTDTGLPLTTGQTERILTSLIDLGLVSCEEWPMDGESLYRVRWDNVLKNQDG